MMTGAFKRCVGAMASSLAALSSTISPALGNEGWLPVISTAEAAPSQALEATGEQELEKGWYPVLIHPPRSPEDKPPTVSAPVAEGAGTRSPETKAENSKQAQAQPAPQPPASPKPDVRRPAEPNFANSKLAEDYCANIADAAADARFAWQKRTLSEMEKELERRIVILETRTAEYREWLARRDAFVKKAQETLVGIYARMRPDAAALQLAAMDEETAAAVLTKLNPRNASAILNEMPPNRAARLTMTIAGAAKVNSEEGTTPAAAGGGRS